MIFFKDKEKNTAFVKDNLMGPNALLILAELLEKVKLNPDMRLLDLGCGTGLTSAYLAKETGAQIFAADLWINPTDNYNRFKELGVEKQIIPLHVDASKPMPFAAAYFDALISVDAYYYFGTGADYLDTSIVPLLKKGGVIAVGIPGRKDESDGEMLEKMKVHLRGETNFHSLGWWKELWQKSKRTQITHAFSMQCHQAAWLDWLESGYPGIEDDIAMMTADGGKFLDTVGLIARVNG